MNGDVAKCQNTTSPSAIKGVPNCNQGCPFLKEFLEFFNKEFIVWERFSMYNKYHKGKIFILYDRF